MPLWKMVNGVRVQMTPAEEAQFEAERAPSLAQLKAELRRRVKTRRLMAEEAGVTVGQNVVETTAEFRLRLRELRDYLAENPGEQVPVRLANGRVVRVSAAQLTAAAKAIMQHIRDCMNAEADHLEAIDALADVPAAQAYDASTGWPA